MKKSMKNRVAGAAAVLLAGSMAFSMTGAAAVRIIQPVSRLPQIRKRKEMKNIQRSYMPLNHLTIFLKICPT